MRGSSLNAICEAVAASKLARAQVALRGIDNGDVEQLSFDYV